MNTTGCYSLIDNYVSREIIVEKNPASEHVARVTPSLQDQLEFQPEDVPGFYVENNGDGSSDSDNGVVVLEYEGKSTYSKLVWHASVDTAAQTSQSGSCPYPVGTNGILDSSTHAAPVISISVTTYSCYPTTSVYINSPTTSNSVVYPSNESPTASTSYLVSVTVTVVALVGIVSVATVIVLVVVTIKRHKKSTEIL